MPTSLLEASMLIAIIIVLLISANAKHEIMFQPHDGLILEELALKRGQCMIVGFQNLNSSSLYNEDSKFTLSSSIILSSMNP